MTTVLSDPHGIFGMHACRDSNVQDFGHKIAALVQGMTNNRHAGPGAAGLALVPLA